MLNKYNDTVLIIGMYFEQYNTALYKACGDLSSSCISYVFNQSISMKYCVIIILIYSKWEMFETIAIHTKFDTFDLDIYVTILH